MSRSIGRESCCRPQARLLGSVLEPPAGPSQQPSGSGGGYRGPRAAALSCVYLVGRELRGAAARRVGAHGFWQRSCRSRGSLDGAGQSAEGFPSRRRKGCAPVPSVARSPLRTSALIFVPGATVAGPSRCPPTAPPRAPLGWGDRDGTGRDGRAQGLLQLPGPGSRPPASPGLSCCVRVKNCTALNPYAKRIKAQKEPGDSCVFLSE